MFAVVPFILFGGSARRRRPSYRADYANMAHCFTYSLRRDFGCVGYDELKRRLGLAGY